MSSYQNLFQDRLPRIESPAKIFAKLKSRVQKEAAQCSRERYGGELISPRRRLDVQPQTLSPISTYVLPDPIQEHGRFGFYHGDVQPQTLSPISTPQKSSRFQCGEPDDTFGLNKSRPMFMSCNMASKRSFLESTAVTYSHRDHFRDPGGFISSREANQKVLSEENGRVWAVSGHDRTRADELQSPSKLVSPLKMRLRTRKCEQSNLSQINSTSGINSEVLRQPRKRIITIASSEDYTQDEEYLGDVRRFSAQQPQTRQSDREPMIPTPTIIPDKRLHVVLEKVPIMTPAKMFALMKERENQRIRAQPEAHEVRRSSRNLFSEAKPYQNTRSSLSSPDVAQTEDAESGMVTETESQVSTIPMEPILLEDPVLLNTPRFSIPRRQPEKNWSRCPQFPSDSVIYLKNWIVRKNSMGLFVDGVHKKDNIPWNSNIIVERISNSVLKTLTGRIYILVGKMSKHVNVGFPKWFLKNFVSGFPSDWKLLYEKLLSESRDRGTKKPEKRKAEVSEEKPETSSMPSVKKKKPETSSMPSVKKKKPETSSMSSVKKKKPETFKTPDPLPSLDSSTSSSAAKVSRSGRTIKPPLEYWKGGRVILDADMNVTIHNCYDSSVLLPTTVSKREKQSKNVFPSSSEGSDGEASVLLRKTKPPVRKASQTKLSQDVQMSTTQPVSPAETNGSTGNSFVTSTRSSKRSQPLEKRSSVDAIPRKQGQPDKTAPLRSGKRTNNTKKPPVKPPKQTIPSSPETSQQQSSESSEEMTPQRQKKDRGGRRKKDRDDRNRPHVSRLSSTSDSSEPRRKKDRGGRSKKDRDDRNRPHVSRLSSTSDSSEPRRKKDRGGRSKKDRDDRNRPHVNRLSSTSDSSEPKWKKDKRGRRKKDRDDQNKPHVSRLSSTSDSSEPSEKKNSKRKNQNTKKALILTKNNQNKRTKPSPPTRSPLKLTSSKTTRKSHKQAVIEDQSEDKWTEAELMRLREAVSYYPKHLSGYWAKVAKAVGRSAEECHNQHTSLGKPQTPVKNAKKSQKGKMEATTEQVAEPRVISAKVGTFKRKQQVRKFLEDMPKDDADDAFSSAYMHAKRVEVPSICMSEENEFTVKDLEPLTPTSRVFPDAKTPQCLHITPGMMGSADWDKDDKYVYHLQKRTKKSQFNVYKQSHSLKRFSPTPTLKQKMTRCANTANDNFAVWEMFPGHEDMVSDSEEEDYYFSEVDQ